MIENEIDPVVFSSERQNTSINLKKQIFRWNELPFWSDEFYALEDFLDSLLGDVSYYGACDLAMGGDYTVIIIIIKDNKTIVCYVIVVGVDQGCNDAIDDIVEYVKRFHFTKFTIESNNFQ
jgi:hypothetical protein